MSQDEEESEVWGDLLVLVVVVGWLLVLLRVG